MPSLPGDKVERDILILLTPKGECKVRAQCYKSLAIYVDTVTEVLADRDTYVVTSLTTGLLLARVREARHASKIMELLWTRCKLAVSCLTPDAMLKALPPWAKLWLLECTKKREFVDPTV